MIDYRQFLREAYDLDDKKKVIRAFANYLDNELDTTFNASTNRYENADLWWAIGNGDNKYMDDRLTVGTRTGVTKGKSDTAFKTLVFLVNDGGKLVAYLDAEDNDLLYNTELLTKAPEGNLKAYAEWYVSVKDGGKSAFSNAAALIRQFFENDELLFNTVDDATSNYSDDENTRLAKALKSREEQTYVSWTGADEEQLQAMVIKARNLRKAIKILEDEMQEAINNEKEAIDKEEKQENRQQQKDIAARIFELKSELSKIRVDVKDLQQDKINFLKNKRDSEGTHLTGREQIELRNSLNKDLVNKAARADLIMDPNDVASYSDKTVNNMLDILNGKVDTPEEKPVKLTKTGKVRKQRAIKTGDVADAKRSAEENQIAKIKAQFKAQNAAKQKAKTTADSQSVEDLIAQLNAKYASK